MLASPTWRARYQALLRDLIAGPGAPTAVRIDVDARARFAEVPGRATAMWLNPRCQPPLLRRLPRVRRLYWARLRDYLIWIASRG